MQRIALQARRGVLKKQLVACSRDMDKLVRYETDLQRLGRQVEIETANYRLYRKKLEESRISEVLDRKGIVNVRVIESPVASSGPVKPRKLLILGIGLALGLLGGLAIALVCDYFDHSIRTVEDVRRHIGLPVLGTFQEMTANDS